MVDEDVRGGAVLTNEEESHQQSGELATKNAALREQVQTRDQGTRSDEAREVQGHAPGDDRDAGSDDATFRGLVLACSDAVFVFGDGFIRFVNPAGEELTGYSHEELQTMFFADLAHPDDLGELTRMYVRRLRSDPARQRHRFRMVTSGRELKWVESSSTYIHWEGQPAILSTIRDVTASVGTENGLRQAHEDFRRRLAKLTSELQRVNALLMSEAQQRSQAEADLRQTEAELRAIVENAPNVAIQRYDHKGSVLSWNEASERIFGWRASEAVGKTLDQLILTREETAAFMKAFMRVERTNRPLGPAESHFLRRDGTDGYCLCTLFAIPCKDNGTCFVSMQVDATEHKRVREALVHSEEYRRLAWDTSHEALAIITLDDATFIDVNEGLVSLTGYARDDVIGRSSLDLLFWEDPHDCEVLVEKLIEHGHVRNFETRIRRKSGESQAALASAGLIVLDGQPHLLLVTKSIEDLKRAELALLESEQKYRLVAENVSDVIWMTDLELNVTYVSPSGEKMGGWSASDWITLKPDELFTPSSLAVARKVLAHELALQNSSGANCHRSRTLQLEQYRKDGATYWTEVTARFLYDEAQRPVSIIGVTRDISEQRTSEEQLNRLFAAVEYAGESILILDARGAILYANPAFEATTGYSVEGVTGTIPDILRGSKRNSPLYEDIWSTIQLGKTWRGRFTSRKKDETAYEETATISPIKDEIGNVVNYVMVCRDLTSEVLLQKQLVQAQKMEAIGTLAGGIAHDFNNLLQAILGYSDLLLMNKGPGHPDKKKLEVIRHAARDGADLVTRILTFSRKGDTKMRPLDLNQEVRRVENLLRRTLPRMIQIDLSLAENLRVITADPAQIEQVILNLGVNAQHAMPEGGRLHIETDNVTVSGEYLRAHLGAKPGEYVLLSVSDTGVGIDPQIMDRIFEPFFTTKINGEGTGLGLAMVHGIVAQHGGYTRCYSEPGMGTSFQMYFPVSETEFVADPSLTREMPAFGSETILLVDDDERVREMARQMIQMGGYKVLIARNGEEALEIYAANKDEISLVILDLIMPGMGGKLCLEELLRIDTEARVLVASGYSSARLGLNPKQYGARGFISKPYDAKGLFGVIRQVLDHGHL